MSKKLQVAEGASACSSALQILQDEWNRLQPQRYRTLTESDEDQAFYIGFQHAIEVLSQGSRDSRSPDEQIDVWEITPHLNTDYDVAIYDNPDRVIEYFRDLAEAALDSLGDGESMTITIKHTTMAWHEYEKCCGD